MEWLTYLDDEAKRTGEFIQLLRSRRLPEACDMFTLSAGPLHHFALDESATDEVAGVPSRPAAIGRSDATVCVAPAAELPEVAGATVILLAPGERAH